MRRLAHSLIFRAGITMAAITFLAVAGMLAGAIVTDTARDDASAINQAGALRGQAYRLGAALEPGVAEPAEIERQVQALDAKLAGSPLVDHLVEHAADAVAAFLDVRAYWRDRLRPALAEYRHDPDAARTAYLAAMDGYAATVDTLVGKIQQEADQRLHRLYLIQIVALSLTLALAFLAMYKLITVVVPPLRELFRAVEQARSGDFALRPGYRGQDEIGLLSQTYNLMAEDLSRLYAELEQRVAQKTAALTRSNQALQVLYDTSRHLSQASLTTEDYRAILDKVASALGLGAITLCLTAEEADRAYKRITTAGTERPGFCHNPNCGACLKSPTGADIHSPRAGMLSIAVKEGARQYGVILVETRGVQLERWQIELLEAVAGQLATSLSLAQQREQQHRLALMDERAVIARELHDSLAQSLSYLKIQVARLQTLTRGENADPTLAEVIAELKEGLNSAYRQLRELLTTFRLKMNEAGLETALRSTVAEFSQRGELHVDLDYRLRHCPLTPNEEVHVLQVVREAMANVIHHAQASDAGVLLEMDDAGEVVVRITDNGVGIPDNWQRQNHYGMAIMQERSQSVGGKLSFQRRDAGGTCVELRFHPQAGSVPPARDDALDPTAAERRELPRPE